MAMMVSGLFLIFFLLQACGMKQDTVIPEEISL